jgi:cysteine sulfinate desulfinase/cysteine desulfurase-like protein
LTLVASAHKFHGPKGWDLHLYEEFRFTALVFWWEQEKACVRNGSTPDCWDGKSLKLSYDNLEEERAQIFELKILEDRLAISFPQSIEW